MVLQTAAGNMPDGVPFQTIICKFSFCTNMCINPSYFMGSTTVRPLLWTMQRNSTSTRRGHMPEACDRQMPKSVMICKGTFLCFGRRQRRNMIAGNKMMETANARHARYACPGNVALDVKRSGSRRIVPRQTIFWCNYTPVVLMQASWCKAPATTVIPCQLLPPSQDLLPYGNQSPS